MNGKQDCYLLFGNSITKGTQKTLKIIKINKNQKELVRRMEIILIRKTTWKDFSAEKQFIMSQDTQSNNKHNFLFVKEKKLLWKAKQHKPLTVKRLGLK